MKAISFIAICQVCQWRSQPCTTAGKAQTAAKQHLNDNPHGDYDDIPLFEGDTR